MVSNPKHKGVCSNKQDLEIQQEGFLGFPPRKLASLLPSVYNHSRSTPALARSGSRIKALQLKLKMPLVYPNNLKLNPSLSSLPARLDLAASKFLVVIAAFNSNQF